MKTRPTLVETDMRRPSSKGRRRDVGSPSERSHELAMNSDETESAVQAPPTLSGEAEASTKDQDEHAYEEDAQLPRQDLSVSHIAVNSIGSRSSTAELIARVMLIEKRLQMLSDEFSTALASLLPHSEKNSSNDVETYGGAGDVNFDAESLSHF